MLLDRNGDLVEWPAASMPQVAPHPTTDNAAGAVALNLRVGNNIRLSDDPPSLPVNMRAQAEPHIARSLGNADLLLGTL